MDIITNSLSATNAKITGNITVNGNDISSYINQKISETASVIYKFKGSVSTINDLLSKEAFAVNGDVWNVLDTDMNYAWVADINKWDPLGSTIDTSKFLTTEVDPEFTSWKNQVVDKNGKIKISELDSEFPNVTTLSNDLKNALTNTFQVKGNYLTEHQSLSSYYTKAEINNMLGNIDNMLQLIIE